MPRLLDHMPFPGEPAEIVVRGERVKVRRDQILIWVSVSRRSQNEPNPAATPFPAILDTGHNHSFSISVRHLYRWAGLALDDLPAAGAIRTQGERIPLRYANLWVHTNRPGRREQLADRPPFLLKTALGVAAYMEGDFPRLPLLGLRAIAENGLLLNVDGRRREAALRTSTWWRIW